MLKLKLIQEVKNLSEQGFNNSEISRRLRIDRGTVRKYTSIPIEDLSPRVAQLAEAGGLSPPKCEFESLLSDHFPFDLRGLFKSNGAIYSYLLGLYITDGYIAKHARTKRLRLFLGSHENYIISLSIKFLQILLPNNTVSTYKRKESRCTEVSVYNSRIEELFPGFGVGGKHKCSLLFNDLQKEAIVNYPKEFILGCLHGDGCKFLHIQSKRYIYNFCNMSLQFKTLFFLACKSIGITFRNNEEVLERRIIVISKKSNLEILDSFWIPKHSTYP